MFKQLFERLVKFFHLESWFRLLVLCVLVGIVAGLGGVLFDRGLHYLSVFVLHDKAHGIFNVATGSLTGLLALILVPGVGLLLAGWLAVRFAPEARGHGSDAVIKAFHRHKGYIRTNIPLIKGLATIFTIGTGGSAGKEGPIAQIGSGFGSFFASTLRLSVRDRRILMLAGCAGGIGAVLRAPLGGALFAAELLYREPDFEHEVVIPGVISSLTAYSIFTAILGHGPLLSFQINSHPLVLHYPSAHGNRFGELLHYALLSLMCAVAAFLMVKGLELTRERFFEKLPVPEWSKAGLGGLILGALAAFMLLTTNMQPGQMMASGKPFMQQVIQDTLHTPGASQEETAKAAAAAPSETPDPETPSPAAGALSELPQITIGILLLGILCKIAATSLTISSGGSGGILFPVLFTGAMTGAAYAKFWQGVPLPDWLTLTPEARAGMMMVGMGGLFSGCTKTPIASLVMVSEMSNSYGLAVPLMLCCCSTYLLTTSFTINESQVARMADSPAHRGDFLVNVLEDIKVSDALGGHAKLDRIPADLPFNKVMEAVKHSTQSTFPIVDEYGCLVGIFSLSDIRQIMNEQEVGHLVVAGDLGTANVRTVTMDTNLSQALSFFTQHNINVLPVVEDHPAGKRVSKYAAGSHAPRGIVGAKRVIGMLTRQNLIAAYRKRIQELHDAEAMETEGSRVFRDAQEYHTPGAPHLFPFSSQKDSASPDEPERGVQGEAGLSDEPSGEDGADPLEKDGAGKPPGSAPSSSP